ncbi:Oxidoreductase, molybdopterin-binding domain-containing protein [Xylariaceae sp. FL0804]|nr:Oxidoreductase, molybdopterin-binding domain-containing protein [Xylariaceae sp. FL0804]
MLSPVPGRLARELLKVTRRPPLCGLSARSFNSRGSPPSKAVPRPIPSPRSWRTSNGLSSRFFTSQNPPSNTAARTFPNIRSRTRPISLILTSIGILTLLYNQIQPRSLGLINDTLSQDASGDRLPIYRLSDIKEHGAKSDRPWVVFKDKVYDITDWIPAHPGGEVILRAAGGSVEPYWDIFAIHKTPYVYEMLEQYLVGQVHPEDLHEGRLLQDHIEDPFQSDPERDERLRRMTLKPCNAETPSGALADAFLTPNEVFYVRNHMWVPVLENNPDDHAITVELPDGEVKRYTVGELKTRFKQHTITAVLQCSGNRRNDMTRDVKETRGLQWTVGAISCAKWEGVRLRDVLADAGLSLTDPGEDAQHVQFSGLEAYGASIPIEPALDPRGDVLLAFKMNDQPLPRDHGFPVRAIVPGHVAARCVKWVNKIVISDEESHTSWQRKDYKSFGPNEVTQDWDKYPSIQMMPITSAITRTSIKLPPRRDDQQQQTYSSSNPSTGTDDAPVVRVEGYAYSGGGRAIQRVDISLDGGRTWDQARLLDDGALERGARSWCWKRWRYEAPLPPQCVGDGDGDGRTTFVVKATDDSYNTQPQSHASIYNLRGNLATAWHRVDFDARAGSAETETSAAAPQKS